MLYHGAVESAIAHLRSIQAIRRKLGLPLSINPERRPARSLRQPPPKSHGMAWSADGSYALAVISATIVSG